MQNSGRSLKVITPTNNKKLEVRLMVQIKKINGLNVQLNKSLELMLAIHSVYLKEHPEYVDEFNFVEVPPISYVNELESIINSVEHQNLINDLIEFTDESECVNIALALTNDYELDKDKANLSQINKYLGNVDLEEFINRFKEYADKINWNSFYESHQQFYIQLYSQFCDFPENLDLNDINNFYGTNETNYNYIPSILMNGGFGVKNIDNNMYYIRGIQWWKEEKRFYYDKKYLLECLFHEFSHPQVNPLVDKYYDLFTNIESLIKYSIDNNLPKTYQNGRTILYEYFVRANAYIMTLKYYPDSKISDWILQHGFKYLNDLASYTSNSINKYNNYEELFKNELIIYMNNILSNKISDGIRR